MSRRSVTLALDMLLVHGGNRRRSLLQQVLPAVYAALQSCLISAWYMERPSLPRC
jgi:hypothetical protein